MALWRRMRELSPRCSDTERARATLPVICQLVVPASSARPGNGCQLPALEHATLANQPGQTAERGHKDMEPGQKASRVASECLAFAMGPAWAAR